jgi:hypothetical protein
VYLCLLCCMRRHLLDGQWSYDEWRKLHLHRWVERCEFIQPFSQQSSKPGNAQQSLVCCSHVFCSCVCLSMLLLQRPVVAGAA